jgi:aspartyl protease family protein
LFIPVSDERESGVRIQVRHLSLTVLLFLLAAGTATAADINVVALTSGKAVVSIDGGKPRSMAVGQVSPEGVKLISSTSESATFEFSGKRQTLAPGQSGVYSAGPRAGDRGGGSVIVTADSRGHFMVDGMVNGLSMRFMVDTGASVIALSREDANRVGVKYLEGTRGRVQTANGTVPVYRVRLDSVKVGDISLTAVDAVVIEEEGRLPMALLGMSFLNRMEMKRDGDTLTLIRRF